MAKTLTLIRPWIIQGHGIEEVTLRPPEAEDFITAHKAALERGAMSRDGTTFLPCPITHGRVLLQRCIVALDGIETTVTDEMLNRLGVIDFETLLSVFATDENASLRTLRAIIGAHDDSSPTRH